MSSPALLLFCLYRASAQVRFLWRFRISGLRRAFPGCWCLCSLVVFFLLADFPPCCCPCRRISIWSGVGEYFHLLVTCAYFGVRAVMGGKGGKKRKSGGLAVPRFGAGGQRTPSPTPSASGSVAGGGVAGAVSWHDAAKVPRLGVVASVADEAIAGFVEGVTRMSCHPPVECLFALPIP